MPRRNLRLPAVLSWGLPLLLLSGLSLMAAEPVHMLDSMDRPGQWVGQGIAAAAAKDCVEGKGALLLTGSGSLQLRHDVLSQADLERYDRLVMDVKIVAGQVTEFGIVVNGFPHTKGFRGLPRWAEYDESTPAGAWYEASFDLRFCEWPGGNAKMVDAKSPALSLVYTPGRGNRGVLVDHVRLVSDPVRIGYDWVKPVRPLRVVRQAGKVHFEKEIELIGAPNRSVPVELRFGRNCLQKFKGKIEPARVELGPGQRQTVTVRIEPGPKLAPLANEVQVVEIVPDGDERLVQRVKILTAAPFPAVKHPFTSAPKQAVRNPKRLLGLDLPGSLPEHPCVWMGQSSLNTWTPRTAGFDQLKDPKTEEIIERTRITSGIWHRRLIGTARSLGYAYQATKDLAYAQKAREIYLTYAREYHKYPLVTPVTQASSYLSPGNATYILGTVVMTPMTRGLDQIWDSGALSQADKQLIIDGLFMPAALEMMKINPGMTNMQDAMNEAIFNMGLLANDPNLLATALFGSHGLGAKINSVFDEDGATPESVAPNYHGAALGPVLAQVESVRNVGLELDFGFERLEKAKTLMQKLRMPDGRVPNRGDSGFPGGRVDAALAEYGSMSFAHYGMTVLRQGEGRDALYVALDHRPPAVTHSHHDKLGIIFYGQGHDFAVDEGSLYNNDNSRQQGLPNWRTRSAWHGHSLVHNTITVDQTNQAFAGGKRLYYHDAEGEYQAVAASTANAYPGVVLERNIILFGDLMVMVDRCLSDTERTYDWVHHSFGELTGPKGLEPRDKLGDKPPYSLPEKVRWGRVDEAAHFTWKREQAAMRLTVLPEAGAASEYATAIGWANKAWRVARQEAPLVLARRRGQEVHFVTVFEPFKGDAPSVQRIERADVSAAGKPVGPEAAVGLRLVRADETLHYLFSFTPGEKSCGPIKTADRLHAVRR